MTPTALNDDLDSDAAEVINQPTLWRNNGWTARVIKNEEDEGWAVAMTQDGESEPALVGPWTMGRDKKNPKPLDVSAFQTLVKTASEVLRRHQHQLHAQLHRKLTVNRENGPIFINLDIVPDEDDPYATLSAEDADGQPLACVRVGPDFKLGASSAQAWIDDDFRQPE